MSCESCSPTARFATSTSSRCSLVFQALREPSTFARVTVDEYGETIVWPNGADLDPDVIYGIAEPASAPAPRVSIPDRA
jgi:hypothetical protein